MSKSQNLKNIITVEMINYVFTHMGCFQLIQLIFRDFQIKKHPTIFCGVGRKAIGVKLT